MGVSRGSVPARPSPNVVPAGALPELPSNVNLKRTRMTRDTYET